MSASDKAPRHVIYDQEYIKKIPLEQILADYGIPVKKGMFTVRGERTPSCKIYPDSNTWADFGGAELRGGGPAQLVMALTGGEWKDAIRILGEHYAAPMLKGGRGNPGHFFISNTQYNLIGLDGACAYKNILKPEYAEKFSYGDIQSIRQKYDMPLNELRKNDMATYTGILKNEAVPFVKGFHNEYLYALYSLKQGQPMYPADSAEVKMVMMYTKEVYQDYSAAFKVLEAATKGTDINVSRLRPDYEKDIDTIGKKSIEIGEYPYSLLKQSGQLHHITLPHDEYMAFKSVAESNELNTPPFSAHVKGDTVTLSCREQDEAAIKRMVGSAALAASRMHTVGPKVARGQDFEVG